MSSSYRTCLDFGKALQGLCECRWGHAERQQVHCLPRQDFRIRLPTQSWHSNRKRWRVTCHGTRSFSGVFQDVVVVIFKAMLRLSTDSFLHCVREMGVVSAWETMQKPCQTRFMMRRWKGFRTAVASCGATSGSEAGGTRTTRLARKWESLRCQVHEWNDIVPNILSWCSEAGASLEGPCVRSSSSFCAPSLFHMRT